MILSSIWMTIAIWAIGAVVVGVVFWFGVFRPFTRWMIADVLNDVDLFANKQDTDDVERNKMNGKEQ